MRFLTLAALALLAASAPTVAQTLYEVRQESTPGAGDFDTQPLLGTVSPYDGSTQTAEAYYNRASAAPFTWQGARPTYAQLGTDQTSLFFVDTSEGLALMVVMGAMSQSNSLWATTTSGPFSGLGVVDDPANADDVFTFAAGTLTASGKIGSGYGDGYGLIVEQGAAAPIYFELDSGTNGFDAASAGLQVLGDDGSGGNTFVTATLQDNRRLRLAPVSLTVPAASAPAAAPGWRLLSAPVSGLDVLDLAQINYVGGVPAGAVNAAQYPGQGQINARGQRAGNLFHAYSGVESTPHHDDPSRDSTALVYVPAPDTDYTFQPGEGIWWYWYDLDFDLGATSGGGIGQSYDLTNPLFVLSAAGMPASDDVTVSFPLATVLPTDYDEDGDGNPDAGVQRDYFYMGGNPFSQPFSVDGISATNGTVQGLVYTWDPTANGGEGNHVPLARSGALDGSGDAAAVWQGFMIQITPTAGAVTNGLGPDVTYDIGMVDAGAAAPFYGLTAGSAPVPTTSLLTAASPTASDLHFTLSSTMASGRVSEDQAWLRFLPDATADFDPHDATKYSLSAGQIAFAGRRGRERVRLGMAAGPDGTSQPLPDKMNLKLDFKADEAGTFTFTWDPDYAEGWRAVLVDRVTGEKTPIRRTTNYTFTSDATDWTDRFIVRVRPAEAATALAPTAKVNGATSIGEPYPNPAAGTSRIEFVLAEEGAVRVTVYDALGREVAIAHDDVLEAGSHTVAIPVSDLAHGAYVVRVEGASFTEARRLTVVR